MPVMPLADAYPPQFLPYLPSRYVVQCCLPTLSRVGRDASIFLSDGHRTAHIFFSINCFADFVTLEKSHDFSLGKKLADDQVNKLSSSRSCLQQYMKVLYLVIFLIG